MKNLLQLLLFFIKRKKIFLIPILLVLILFAGILIIGQASTVSPFIYAIF